MQEVKTLNEQSSSASDPIIPNKDAIIAEIMKLFQTFPPERLRGIIENLFASAITSKSFQDLLPEDKEEYFFAYQRLNEFMLHIEFLNRNQASNN